MLSIDWTVKPMLDLSETEIDEITALVNVANRDHRGVFPGDRLGPGYLLEDYGDTLALSGRNQARLIACGALLNKENALWLYILAAHPDHRGQGLGAEMMLQAEKLAKRNGLPNLMLQAVDQGTLVAYYLSQGFKEVKRETKPEGHWGAVDSFELVDLIRPVT